MTWQTVALSSIAEVALGRQRSPQNHTGPSMRKYLRAANVGWSGLLLDDVKQMNFSDDEMETFRLRPGDILLNEASGSAKEVGKPALWNDEITQCAFQNTLLRVRPSDKADPKYLLQYFRHQASTGEFARGSRGASINHLGRAALSRWPVPLPALTEQRRIAQILDKADALLVKRRQLLKEVESLGPAVFEDMFGNPVTNRNGLPIGTIRDLVESADYGTSEKSSLDGEIAVLRMNNISYTGRVDLQDLKYMDLPTKSYKRYTVRAGDVLFNRTNSAELVGKTAVYRGDAPLAYAGYLVRLRVREGFSPDYLSGLLNSRYGKTTLRGMCKSIVGMANINAQEVQTIRTLIPPKSAQEEYSDRVAAIEYEIDRHATALAKLDELFASLQARAFRGEL